MTSHFRPSPFWILIIALGLGLGACSEAGLHKADGRTHYAEKLTASHPDKCVLKAQGKGKRELAYTCPQTLANAQKGAVNLCDGHKKMGFETLVVKGKDGAQKCNVLAGCTCEAKAP